MLIDFHSQLIIGYIHLSLIFDFHIECQPKKQTMKLQHSVDLLWLISLWSRKETESYSRPVFDNSGFDLANTHTLILTWSDFVLSFASLWYDTGEMKKWAVHN